jgi:hypothetical protein
MARHPDIVRRPSLRRMASAVAVLVVAAGAVAGDVWAWNDDSTSRSRGGVLLFFSGVAVLGAIVGVMTLVSSFATRMCRHCRRPLQDDGRVVAFPPTALPVLVAAHERHDLRGLHELAGSPRRVVARTGRAAGIEVISCTSCSAVGEIRVGELPKGLGAYATG